MRRQLAWCARAVVHCCCAAVYLVMLVFNLLKGYQNVSILSRRWLAWWIYWLSIEVPCRWAGTLLVPEKLCFCLPPVPTHQQALATRRRSTHSGEGSTTRDDASEGRSTGISSAAEHSPHSHDTPFARASREHCSITSPSMVTPSSLFSSFGSDPRSKGEGVLQVNRRIVLGGRATFVVVMMPWERAAPTIDFAIRFASCLQCDALVLTVDHSAALVTQDFEGVLAQLSGKLVFALSDGLAEETTDAGGDTDTPARCVMYGSGIGARLVMSLARLPQVKGVLLQDPIVAKFVAKGTGDGTSPSSNSSSPNTLKKGKTLSVYESAASAVEYYLKPIAEWREYPTPVVPTCALVDCFGPWTELVQDWVSRCPEDCHVAQYNARDPVPALAIVQNWTMGLLTSGSGTAFFDPSSAAADPFNPNFPSLAAMMHSHRRGELCRLNSWESFNVSNISGDELLPEYQPRHVFSEPGSCISSVENSPVPVPRRMREFIPHVHSGSSFSDSTES